MTARARGRGGGDGTIAQPRRRPSRQVMAKVLKAAEAEVTDPAQSKVLARMKGRWQPDVFAAACERAVRQRDPVAMEWCARVGHQELLLFSEHMLWSVTGAAPLPP